METANSSWKFMKNSSITQQNTEGEWGHLHVFLTFFLKGNNFCDFMFASLEDQALSHGVYS